MFIHGNLLNSVMINRLMEKNPETTILVDMENSYDNLNWLVARQSVNRLPQISEIFQKVMECMEADKLRVDAIKKEIEKVNYDFHNSELDFVLKSQLNKKKGGRKNGRKKIFVLDSIGISNKGFEA